VGECGMKEMGTQDVNVHKKSLQIVDCHTQHVMWNVNQLAIIFYRFQLVVAILFRFDKKKMFNQILLLSY
jgi:hypothetical protein